MHLLQFFLLLLSAHLVLLSLLLLNEMLMLHLSLPLRNVQLVSLLRLFQDPETPSVKEEKGWKALLCRKWRDASPHRLLLQLNLLLLFPFPFVSLHSFCLQSLQELILLLHRAPHVFQ